MIAGHTFDPLTDKCTATVGNGDERRVCGIHWLAIRNVTEADIGRNGIAHVAHLSASEYAEIAVRRDAEDARFDLAMREMAG